jgi:osmotically-inducible protein OsmY
VPTEQDRQNIDAIIRSTSGVRSLDDQLRINAQPTGVGDTRIYSTAPVVANTSAPGNIFNLHVQGLNEPDRTLAQRILHELRADTILPSLLPMVNITVADGRVTLDGNVQSEQQRQTIESAVRRATGANTVNDLLQVR